MNVLSKKIVLCAIVLFLTQSVCAMWDFGSRAQEIYNEDYFQELEDLQAKQDLEDKEAGIYSKYPRIEEVSTPQESKKHNETPPRTSRKSFRVQNREKENE